MNYSSIRNCDIANGDGVRCTLFVSGCTRGCKGCFNPQQLDFDFGKPFTKEVEDYILDAVSKEWVSGLSILGGEPLHPMNSKELVKFVRRFRERFGDTKTIWVYTGCLYEELYDPTSGYYSKDTQDLVLMTDVLVDGPFVEEMKDPSLEFRGSSNQRIIHIHHPENDIM